MSAPLCIGCKHLVRSMDPICQRPLSSRFNPVNGESVDRVNRYADSERRGNRTLFGRVKWGPEGRFFEGRHHGTPPKPGRG